MPTAEQITPLLICLSLPYTPPCIPRPHSYSHSISVFHQGNSTQWMRALDGNCYCSQSLLLLLLSLFPLSWVSSPLSLSPSTPPLSAPPRGRSTPPLYQPPRVLLGPTLTPAYGVRTAGVSLRAPSVNFFPPDSPAYIFPLLTKTITVALELSVLYVLEPPPTLSLSHLFRKLQTISEYGTSPW